VFGLLVVSSLLTKSRASDPYGIGIGIRKDGPLRAYVGDVIQYTITIYNTGDSWIRNITIKDLFPNGTIATWVAPDLSPATQIGDSFNISRILYTIRNADVLQTGSPHIINFAEVTGYADVEGLGLLVHAETNFPTFILVPTVGGYSVSMNASNLSTPTVIYVVFILGMTAFLGISRHYETIRSTVFGRPKKHKNPQG
jgi:uncharacterized repeat protein (TIGR01451 family)